MGTDGEERPSDWVPLFYLQAAAPAAPQSVRNAPRIVCVKAERAPKLRKSAAAASEDVPRAKRV